MKDQHSNHEVIRLDAKANQVTGGSGNLQLIRNYDQSMMEQVDVITKTEDNQQRIDPQRKVKPPINENDLTLPVQQILSYDEENDKINVQNETEPFQM